MKTRIIVNPMANKGGCGKRWLQIRVELEKHLGPIDDNHIAMTRAPSHATALARDSWPRTSPARNANGTVTKSPNAR